MKFSIKGPKIEVIVDAAIYNEDVVFKCFYWYSRDFIVDITKNKNEFMIILEPKTAGCDELLLKERVAKDLIDFRLRDTVSKETKTIRELIIAKAFAYYEDETIPEREISDPVGFNPQNISR